MKLAICLIIKTEILYLEHWLNHYRKLGVDHFFIYDNNVTKSIDLPDKDCTCIAWSREDAHCQGEAYVNCCKNNKDYDYIGFFDIDEYVMMSEDITIKEMLCKLREQCGDFDALGIYWRCYGKSKPYYETSQSVDRYTEYWKHYHIKSFINPKVAKGFPDPHKAVINGRYIDELGRTVVSHTGEHTSKYIWIKHIWTRSLQEWKVKFNNGRVDRFPMECDINEFYIYNDKCNLKD